MIPNSFRQKGGAPAPGAAPGARGPFGFRPAQDSGLEPFDSASLDPGGVVAVAVDVEVLVSVRRDACIDALAEALGVSWWRVREAVRGSGLEGELEAGRLGAVELVRAVCAELGVRGVDGDGVRAAWSCAAGAVDGQLAAAASGLSGRGALVLVGGLSPWTLGAALEALDAAGVGPAPVWATCDQGWSATDPAFYGGLLGALGPLACRLFIAADPERVGSAEACGMRTWLHRGVEETCGKLSASAPWAARR